MRLMDLVPKQISAQLIALMIFAVVIFNAMMTTAFFVFPPAFGPPPNQRQERMQMNDAGPDASGHGLSRPLGESSRVHHPPPMFGGGPIIATILFLTISLGILGIWAARALVAPLKKIVSAAEHYRVGDGSALLAEEGPTEIRTLARALNEMQTRISELMAERTRMLAAISHDLRTPITRLRLRAEFMPDVSEQRRMIADLDHMEALVRGALVHLQDGKTGEGVVSADLSSLLQTISDQFGDLGQDVRYFGPAQVAVRIRPHEFQRAITNLVENAVRYGEAPQIVVERQPSGELEIRVEDSGPGIAADLRSAMVEPFTRGNAARSMNEFEGFGLGLAIARSIAESHDGRLDLRDRSPHGLAAVVVLPPSAVVHCG